MFDVAPEDSDKLEDASQKEGGGGQLTDEDFGDDEVERITGGEPENEKTSNSDEQPKVASNTVKSSGGEEVYSSYE